MTVELRADLGEHRRGAPLHRRAIDEAALRRNRAEAEILGHRQVLAEGELLVHHPDAGGERVARAVEVHLVAVDDEPPVVRRVHAGEDLSRACSCPRRSRRTARDTTRRQSSSDTSLSACTPGNRFVMCSKRTAGLARHRRVVASRVTSSDTSDRTLVKPQSFSCLRPGAEVLLRHLDQLHRDDLRARPS